MKLLKLITFFSLVLLLTSCRVTYKGYIGQNINTEIDLSNSNFNVLGSFTGSYSVKKTSFSVKNQGGIISEAKKNLIENAKKEGVELKGSRALVNVTTDIVQNRRRITCTMSAEIIEFTK
jgi:hypothetical protein